MCRGLFSAVEPDMSCGGPLSTFTFQEIVLISCALENKNAKWRFHLALKKQFELKMQLGYLRKLSLVIKF